MDRGRSDNAPEPDGGGIFEPEVWRVELTGYCYRMLGSAFEAEDAVQETMIRAWRSADSFEGRSSLRTWLYRIATNVCLDHLEGAKRRARPMDLSSPVADPTGPGEAWPADGWIAPVPDTLTVPASADPAEAAVLRESVQLAFVACLQHLPSSQRSVLLLRDVMGLSAAAVAELQDISVAAANSVLQRARATMAAKRAAPTDVVKPSDPAQAALLARYVEAFQAYDMEALSLLLHVDATLSLPPYATWMRGADAIENWLTGPAVGCRGSRLLPTFANGTPAFAQYRPSTAGSGFDPWALQVVEVSGGRVVAINAFFDTERLFPLFGMPDHLEH